ncbi:phosphonate C-P lyase system protein PhnH [Microbaculum marinum]|uniref:Phosphonate C-P lyase system protein PhnH n=2 Tax=Microbaculum marinum TaxID=1764581 RepID=A0AAW9RJ53_9HYPH
MRATAALSGGFQAPVHDSQAVFRTIMNALARPGTVHDLTPRAKPPATLSAEAGAVALALLDHETPVWCDQALAAAPAVADWLRFNTGAPIVAAPEEAEFAFVADPLRMPPLSSFAQGTADYPDRSTTLVVAVETLDARTGADIRGADLRGPGIATTARLAPHPLPHAFWDQARANHARFPRGVDLLFTAPGRIAGLPRSTRILAPEA